MKISTKGRYALRVMADIALHDDGESYVSLRDIAGRQGITVKYLEQIIPLLSRAGYLKSARGTAGGYRLTRAPEQYTVGDILRVMESSLAPVACLEEEPNRCPRRESCTTLAFWQGLNETINQYVNSFNLRDLMGGGTEGMDYCI